MNDTSKRRLRQRRRSDQQKVFAPDVPLVRDEPMTLGEALREFEAAGIKITSMQLVPKPFRPPPPGKR